MLFLDGPLKKLSFYKGGDQKILFKVDLIISLIIAI